MSNQPSISVLIPTYNYARFIGEAIESVLAQDFRDFELLVVDDCSTDNTTEVVQAFCWRDPRVRFVRNESNLGLVHNWNHSLQLARGRYIKFLFADDTLYHPQALGILFQYLERNPSVTLAASARAVLDENSKQIGVLRHLPEGIHDGPTTIASCIVENTNFMGEPSAVMFRKTDASRGFDPQYLQVVDMEMWFHLLAKGDLAYSTETLCGFRRHANQQTMRNIQAHVAYEEHDVFMREYVPGTALPTRVFFPPLLELRRRMRNQPDQVTPAMREREKLLAGRMGKFWYACHFAGYRITRPFRKLAGSVKKRLGNGQV